MRLGNLLKRFFSFFMAFIIMSMMITYFPIMHINAVSATAFQQSDSRWGNHEFNKRKPGNPSVAVETGNTISQAGCSLLSVVNSVYYKTNIFLDPCHLADFAKENGYRVAGTDGVTLGFFKAYCNEFGANNGFYYAGSTTSASTALQHIRSGGTACFNIPGHWIAVVEYDSSKDKYLILDSAAGSSRTSTLTWEAKGVAWVSSSVLCSSSHKYGLKYSAQLISYTNILPNDDELGIPYPRPSGTPYLKTGSMGSGVRWLQTALNNLMNAGLSVDGQFGIGTKNAVIKFQEQYGLEADGVVGPSTINKLVECLKNKLTPIPATPVAVVENVSPGTATFSWNAVEGATSYKITFRKSGDEYAVEAENYTGTSWTKTGLQPNTKYWFRVYAVNGSGSSPHSESISATTEAALDVGSDFTAMILNVNSKYLLTDEDYNAFFTKPTDTTNQFWYFSRNSNGSYTIETNSRKYALDVSGGNTADGTNIQLYEKNGTLSQQWFLCQAENGLYFKSALGNYALDMSGTSLGANAHLWQFNGTAAQIFDFYRIDLDGNSPVDLGDNFYAKIENTATGKMLANSGNNVAGADAEDAKNQLWHFIRKSNGSYEIISYSDDKSIDVSNYGTANGTNIGTSAQADNIAQRFFLYKIDGGIYIKTACSNNVFNMDLNTLNVAAWNYVNGVNPERFQIHKIESSVSKIVIATPAKKTEYKVGESLDTTGLTLKVTYNTGDTKTVSSGFTAKYDFSEAGDKTVTITYDGKSTTYNATVNYSAFIITFDAGDGVCEVANKKVKYESAYGVLPTAEKAGYTFDGWVMADGTVIDSTNIVMITENTTVYATYSNASYIITFDAVYGTCDVENKKVKYGSAYGVLPDAEREGYIFHGWCLQGGTEISSTDIVTLTADTTVYALWEEEIITGDVNADGTFTAADAVMLQKWLLNAGGINNWYAGDLCEDEVLNVFDLCVMKQLLSQN